MAFDPVPWAISGSQLDTYVMRQFANMATSDAEGVHLPGGGKVTALGSPSGNVNVSAGGLIIRNAQAAGQSYAGRIGSDTIVPVPPTSGSSRSDLIVATIRDPDFSPWQAYTDPNQILFGPYFFPERLAASSGTTRAGQIVTYSAYALARIDIPAGTTNILNSMITDLRALAQPRLGFAQGVQVGPGAQENVLLTDTTWKNWPSNSLAVTVPPWATNCLTEILLNQVQADGPSDFQGRVNLGGLTGAAVDFDYNGNPGSPAGFVEGIPLSIFADLDVRSLQGQTVVVRPQVQRTFTQNTGSVWFNNRQQVKFDLRFVERAV